MANKKTEVGFETQGQMNEFIKELNEDAVYFSIADNITPSGGYVLLCKHYFDYEKGEGWLDYSEQYLLRYGDCVPTYLQKQVWEKKKGSQEA